MFKISHRTRLAIELIENGRFARAVTVLLFAWAIFACGRDPGASIFRMPEITNVYADAEAHRVVFRCDVLRAENIRECGVYFGETEENLQKIPGVLSDEQFFTAERKALESGHEYYFKAFVSNGTTEYSTALKRFRTIAGDPAISVPDPFFRDYLLRHFDENDDGVLSRKETFHIRKIEVPGDSIETLTGIEQFSELETLFCAGTIDEFGVIHGRLRDIDLSRNSLLTRLNVEGNRLTELDIHLNPFLQEVNLKNNRIVSLDISNNSRLHFLGYSMQRGARGLTTLNLRACPSLIGIAVDNGYAGDTIDFSNNRHMDHIYFNRSAVRHVILPPSPKLQRLELQEDKIEGTLDLRLYKSLRWLFLNGNPYLEKVILPAGLKLEEFRVDPHVKIEYSSF